MKYHNTIIMYYTIVKNKVIKLVTWLYFFLKLKLGMFLKVMFLL